MAGISVRELRSRWKLHKERLNTRSEGQGTLIRFHRACSWLARVETMPADDVDLALVSLWIAFNALYGQWDPIKREPKADRECWRAFCDSILKLDRDHRVVDALQDNKKLVLTLLEDESLYAYYWRSESFAGPGYSHKGKRNGQNWYVEGRWCMLLDEILERVYLMRCQLVHGAATYGGQLNRTSLRRCVWMLRHLLTACLTVWVDHGAEGNWGPPCYPPARGTGQSRVPVGRPPLPAL